VGVLIYFIHHMSVSIQVDEVAARISTELIERIDHLFPKHIAQGAPVIPTEPSDVGGLALPHKDARAVGAGADGYLQFMDVEALLALATEEDVVVRLERRPGHYVVAGRPLATIWPGSRVTDRLSDQVRSSFVLGHQRTADQDIEFGVNQLVEIAVRALSPGMNDPFTAITCVDHMGSVLCRLATREMPSQYRHDHQNRLRVIAPANAFPEFTDAAFSQVRQYGRSSVAVTIRLLETIAVVAGFAHRPEDRTTLLRHAEMIARGALEALPEKEDRGAVEEGREAAFRACTEAATSCR
jgi:uncharacterized membrane protein